MKQKPSGKKSLLTKCQRHVITLILLAALLVSLPNTWITPTKAADSETWTVGTWTEYPGNSVFAGVSRAYYPCVLLIDGTYHMWYTDGGYQTGYTNSSDDITWGSPTIVTGLGGNPGHAVVVNVGTQTEPYYRIWYANELVWPDNVDVIRTAESADGINWSNDQPLGQINNVIQENNPSEPNYKWMFGSYGPEAVLYNFEGYETLNETDPMGNKYVMYYDGYARTSLTAGINEYPMLAISVDGINWKRVTDEPLILPSGGTTEWDANYISVWSVLKRSDGYHLWYSGGISDRNDGIGYATSVDGLSWTKCGENPLLSVDDGVAWRDDRTYCPWVIEDNGVFKMWFAGKDTATGSYTIGYATIGSPLPDFYGIQYAIDTVDSGDILVVSAGTYNERITIEKPLTLRGATANVNKNGYTVPTNYAWDSNVETIINNPTPELTATISVVTIKDTSDVTFEGFIVQSLNAPLGSANDMLLYIDVKSGTMENITIRNNVIGPNTNVTDQDGTAGRMGLDISVNQYRETPYGLVNSSITGNKIFNCEGNGNNVFIWGAYYAYGARHPSPMEGTVIEDNEISGSHRSGIEIAGGISGLTIRNNTISDNSGLPTDDPTSLKYGNGIVLIRGSSDSGEQIGLGPENLTIKDNDIINNEKNGIYTGPVSKNYVITGNNIQNNGWDGIRLDMEAHYKNPTFEDQDRVGFFEAAENVTATHNNIYDNSELGVNVIGEPTNGFVLNATYNWWGTTDPDLVAASTNGSVVFDPWLDPAHPDTLILNEKSGFYYQKIQSAIDAASDYDTINVPTGVYNERITIEKPLTLRGATANVNKNGYTVPTNYAWDSNVETIINNPTPALEGSVVYIQDTNDVTFEGFIVQKLNAVSGRNNENVFTIEADSFTMQNITIRNNIIGPNTNVAEYQDGTYGRMGLYININQYQETPYGLVNSTISGNKIFDCTGNGDNIFIWGAYYAYGARHPSPMEGTVIEDNEITGSHRTGIEIAGGCSGLTIQNNIISNNNGLTTDDPLLKYGSGIVLIRGSSDSESSTGLGPENLTIVGNDIFSNEKNGIYMGPVSKNHNITGNNIHDNGWDGIRLDMEAHYYNPDFETVDRTALFNATENITTTYNNIYDNSELGVNVVGTPENGFVLNATLNWWGAASGPDDDADAINGDGDRISEHVVADPWITDAYGLSMEEILEPEGVSYSSAPTLSNFGFDAAISNLKNGWYNLNSGVWTQLFSDLNVPEWNNDNWQVPNFAGLTDGTQTVYFKVEDVFGHESDVWSWEFYIDKTGPTISNSTIDPTSGEVDTVFTITTEVDDEDGVQSVRASIQKPDETEVASVVLTSGSAYSGLWDSSGFAEGVYYVDIIATDNAGNVAEEENSFHFPILAMPVINWTCCRVPANQTGYVLDAKNETGADISLNTTSGTPVVTVACCEPQNTSGFSCDVDKYIDVNIDDPESVESLEIKIYYTSAEVKGLVEESLRIYWWTGIVWKPCSNSGVNTTDVNGYSGYIWAIITADTSPSLADLSGTPFGANEVELPVGGTFVHTSNANVLERLTGQFLVEQWVAVVAFGLMVLGGSLLVSQKKSGYPSRATKTERKRCEKTT